MTGHFCIYCLLVNPKIIEKHHDKTFRNKLVNMPILCKYMYNYRALNILLSKYTHNLTIPEKDI